jgi:hypothetical protein
MASCCVLSSVDDAQQSRENQGILPNLTFQPNFWLANRISGDQLARRDFCLFSVFAWCSDTESSLFDPTQIGPLKVKRNVTFELVRGPALRGSFSSEPELGSKSIAWP